MAIFCLAMVAKATLAKAASGRNPREYNETRIDASQRYSKSPYRPIAVTMRSLFYGDYDWIAKNRFDATGSGNPRFS